MGSNRQRRVWYWHPDGHAIASDELIETENGVVLPPPVFCSGQPRHVLKNANGSVVGWTACHVSECHGHLVHTCGACGSEVFQPEPSPHCRPFVFDGRAAEGDLDG
ncbi:MAG: hypothetical protein JWN03_1212 [Nocardia sp.]|uniref:hypothetical protein n=1 Tax=Nocardia sp. TaxID=1821 RepID=UPI00260AEE88|nr:hypothetical protein [Nocardia sp.]MCU1640937.1 hypothetical protein [Nocardia sp.]